MEKIRFGVVGTGFITEHVLAGGREDARFEAVAVCSRTKERGKAFAAAHGIPHTFTSVEEMAACPLVDAVYIASPNVAHAWQSITCMRRGKHVLCEKAFASNVGEVRTMIATAYKYGVTLMEAMKPVLTPGFRAVRKALAATGVVRQYFSCYCQYSSRYDSLKEGRVLNAFNPELSNGATMDIGVYTIYPMVVLFGRPKQIYASGIKLYSGVDGQANVVFTYDGGLCATVVYGKIADSNLPTEIHGEDGSIMLDRINVIGKATLKRRNGEVEHIMPDTPHHEYYYEVAEFIDLILSGRQESSINSFENSLITMEILDEIRRQLGVSFPADGWLKR
ncbi:MAG: Gfo/Idh/MocA family oxidoreductase [Tannerella sp.]|jgi:predicted dehydrogenase|nr:Gfo/Idh/MocA family oxidoreductase [Tannerella sp.]